MKSGLKPNVPVPLKSSANVACAGIFSAKRIRLSPSASDADTLRLLVWVSVMDEGVAVGPEVIDGSEFPGRPPPDP